MNDLSGLSWTSSASASANNDSQPNRYGDRYQSLRPTPPTQSRQPSPLSSNGRITPGLAPSTTPKPAGDSFASLLNTGNKKTGLSLQEKQKQLLEEKRRQASGLGASDQNRHDPFNTSDAAFWEGLGSGRSTPANAAAIAPAMTSVCA